MKSSANIICLLLVVAGSVYAGPISEVLDFDLQQVDDGKTSKLTIGVSLRVNEVDGGEGETTPTESEDFREKLSPSPKLENSCEERDDCFAWHTGEWNQCTKRCGFDGIQSRTVECYRVLADGQKAIVEKSNCTYAGLKRPKSKQPCKRWMCPEWKYGAWSTCSSQCGDAGKQYRPLLCEDGNYRPLKAAECEGAPPTDGTVRNCTLTPCAKGRGQAHHFSPQTAPNMSDEAKNGAFVARCNNSTYGCCPDWYTPARGPNYKGCPTYQYDTCEQTVYGCCPDGVALARGPNHEGCGKVQCWRNCCQTTLFGCCQDQTRVAFGPNYAGCDRSPVACEHNDYGCCHDGETQADYGERSCNLI